MAGSDRVSDAGGMRDSMRQMGDGCGWLCGPGARLLLPQRTLRAIDMRTAFSTRRPRRRSWHDAGLHRRHGGARRHTSSTTSTPCPREASASAPLLLHGGRLSLITAGTWGAHRCRGSFHGGTWPRPTTRIVPTTRPAPSRPPSTLRAIEDQSFTDEQKDLLEKSLTEAGSSTHRDLSGPHGFAVPTTRVTTQPQPIVTGRHRAVLRSVLGQ